RGRPPRNRPGAVGGAHLRRRPRTRRRTPGPAGEAAVRPGARPWDGAARAAHGRRSPAPATPPAAATATSSRTAGGTGPVTFEHSRRLAAYPAGPPIVEGVLHPPPPAPRPPPPPPAAP